MTPRLIQISFLFLTTGMGFLSILFLQELWQIEDVNLQLSFTLFFTYLIIFSLCTIGLAKIEPEKIKVNQIFGRTSSIFAVFFFFFASLIFISQGLTTDYWADRGSFPLSNFFLLFLLIVPFHFLLSGNKTLGYLFCLIAMFSFSILQVRINLLMLFILILMVFNFSTKKLDFKSVFFLSFIFFITMMTISILRADVENEISAIAFISKIAASFGSEWRDGTFFHERLTVADISFVKENFKYNFLTFIPGWSFFAPLSAQELINAQMVSILSEILGLRDLGVSGLRIGMSWEAYILFGYFGVVTIAIFSAILTRISHLLILRGELVPAAILISSNIYLLIGFPLFTISNFGQLIVFYLLLKLPVSMLQTK